MKVTVLGGGFTGLVAALRLLQKGHQVIILEKESQVGGLAGGFKEKDWDWALEKTYHHFFTSDKEASKLALELGVELIVKRPTTDVYIDGRLLPFDSPSSILKFPYLSPVDRIRTGLVAAYLKILSNHHLLAGKQALPWIRRFMGKKVAEIIWEPLFIGKFGNKKDLISLTWFWARIKKRTPKLAYPEGGFQNLAEKLALKISQLGGEILLSAEVLEISDNIVTYQVTNKKNTIEADKIISTLPTPIFIKTTPGLPKEYIQRISSIPHLSALNLILILNKPFFNNTYWLNITDTKFPFLVLAEHTNFIDPKYYGNKHILYIGNYLEDNHRYFKMSKEELLKEFDPFLKKIVPSYSASLLSYHLQTFHNAQPVATLEYPKLIPEIQTPIKNVFLANMDMVYPWDRGTNYAIELGEKAASIIS